MNFESVSVESPRLVPSQANSLSELKRKMDFGNDGREARDPNVSDGLLKQIMIEIASEKIGAHSLCGGGYVRRYLMGLYRRNCRPNTIRARFDCIFLFLKYLKARAVDLLELVSREDLCGFIEHEQDRGLKPSSVSGRVDGVYAFIGFLVNREVLCPELLKRKLRIKVPDSLPRAPTGSFTHSQTLLPMSCNPLTPAGVMPARAQPSPRDKRSPWLTARVLATGRNRPGIERR